MDGASFIGCSEVIELASRQKTYLQTDICRPVSLWLHLVDSGRVIMRNVLTVHHLSPALSVTGNQGMALFETHLSDGSAVSDN